MPIAFLAVKKHYLKPFQNSMKNTKKGGFTLIEILIVIGIIAVLAAIVLVAVNPARQFAQANNAQRLSNVNAILNAVGQYNVDKRGDVSALNIPATADDIGGGTGEVDLCALVPKYIPALPVDPKTKQTGVGLEVDDQSISKADCTKDYKTGYLIVLDNDNLITVSAPNAEDIDGKATKIAAPPL